MRDRVWFGCLGLLAALGLLVLLFVWLRQGVRISVTNEADPASPLVHVTLSVHGDSARIADIGNGERESVRLHPKGESDVTLSFVLDGKPQAVSGGYVEDNEGYRVDFLVRGQGAVVMRYCLGPTLLCNGELRTLSE